MIAYYHQWRANEKIKEMTHYLLQLTNDEEKIASLKNTFQTALSEADACKEKYLFDLPARQREWEYRRMIDELDVIKYGAILEAKKIIEEEWQGEK